VIACGPSLTPTASPTAFASLTPAPVATAASPATASTGSGEPSAAQNGSVEVDSSLLSHVPATVGGVKIEPDPGTAAQIAADPDLAGDVERLAVGLAVGPGSSGAEDVAIVNVVALRDGVLGEPFFRGWRDSYDEAACGQAGGVSGHAEAAIDARTVYIGSCNGGARTYHVAIEEDDLVVAVTSVGPGRWGEQVVSNLVP
jgi:hypothetical protein